MFLTGCLLLGIDGVVVGAIGTESLFKGWPRRINAEEN
jgi:hypothetical protein